MSFTEQDCSGVWKTTFRGPFSVALIRGVKSLWAVDVPMNERNMRVDPLFASLDARVNPPNDGFHSRWPNYLQSAHSRARGVTSSLSSAFEIQRRGRVELLCGEELQGENQADPLCRVTGRE